MYLPLEESLRGHRDYTYKVFFLAQVIITNFITTRIITTIIIIMETVLSFIDHSLSGPCFTETVDEGPTGVHHFSNTSLVFQGKR